MASDTAEILTAVVLEFLSVAFWVFPPPTLTLPNSMCLGVAASDPLAPAAAGPAITNPEMPTKRITNRGRKTECMWCSLGNLIGRLQV